MKRILLDPKYPNLPESEDFRKWIGYLQEVETRRNFVFRDQAALVNMLARYSEAHPNNNIVINGDFVVWQDGTTFTAPGANVYLADCWVQRLNVTAGRFDYTQDTSAPSFLSAVNSRSSMKINCSTADAALGATDQISVAHLVEGYDYAQVAQRTFTLSFWVRASVTGTYAVSFANSGADRTYVAEYLVNQADTWEFKSICVDASPSAGTWNYTNGTGISVRFALMVGSNFQTTPGTWQTGNFTGTANCVNLASAVNQNMYLTGVRLTPGPFVDAFSIRPFQQEMALCERRYWKSFPYATAPAQNTGVTTGCLTYQVQTAGVRGDGLMAHLPVRMRTTPAITFYNPNAANANWRNVTLAADSGVAANTGLGEQNFGAWNPQVAGDAVGNFVQVHATANARL